MSGTRTRRPAALLLAVAAALTALVAGGTQAGAAPATGGTTTFTLHFPSADGASAAATIVCQAKTTATIIYGLDDSVYGTGTSKCPVAMTNLVAQTTLYQWSPDLGRWEPVSYGKYDSGPGQNKESTTGEYLCAAPRTYVASTYHFARLGNATATAVTTSQQRVC
ncbi:hypothetical protein [Amycolatopsis sp. cmx-11-51]|uniref:hypothetical protein n=1 Tax=unclassified Amycolatopsis TaxID=2618356 RepID=UPI0039E43772